MTSHRVPAPLLLLCTFATACYSPHDEVTSGGADEGGSSESDTGTNPTTAPSSTANPSEPTSSPTGETDDSDPSTSVDSTGDSGGPAVCGDGMVEGDEVCDDGVNDGSYDGCVADCTARGPHCGDGEEQGDEVCDDGDQTNGDGCNNNCVVSGSVLWTQTPAVGSGQAISIDVDGGVLAAFYGVSLRYYDSEGAPGWTGSYSYPEGSAEFPRSVSFHDVEGWVVAGTASTEAGGIDAWWRYYSEGGGPGVATEFDNPSHTGDRTGGAVFDGDGRLYVVGSSDLGGDYDVWLRKFDLDGEEMWTQPYDGGGGDDGADGIAIDADGYIVIGGSSYVESEGRNGWLRKYSPEGGLQWQQSFSGPGGSSDWVQDIAVGTDGSIAAIGNQSDDIWVSKYDAEGEQQWFDTYDGPSDVDCVGIYCFWMDAGLGVAIDSSGAVIAVGREVDSGDEIDTDGHGTWVRKYGADGVELWTDRIWPGPYSTSQGAADVVVTAEDDIIVVGTMDTGDEMTGWVQKYAP